MSILPKIEKDANGLPIIKGVQDQPQYYTKKQVEVSDILGTASRLKGATGDNIVKLLKDNPANAAGLMVSSGLAGLTPNNSITKNLVELNRVTKEAQALDTQQKYNLESTKKFEGTFVGKFWSALKSAARGVTAVSLFPIEMVNAQFSLAAKELSGIYHQWADGKKIDKNQGIADYKNMFAQTTLGQIASDAVGGRGVHLGSGFFPSESEGAGLAARKKQLETFSIKVDGKLDENGHQIYRPYSFVDPVSWMLTGGAYGKKWFGGLEGHTAQVVDGIGELVASFYIDPFIAASKISKAADVVKEASRTKEGLASARNIVAEKEFLLKDAEATKNVNNLRQELLASTNVPDKIGIANKLKLAVDEQTKIKDAYGNVTINPEAIATFISGKHMSPIIDKIVGINSPAKIFELGKGKIPAYLAADLANASSREEVLKAFAPFVNNGDVVGGILKTGTTIGMGRKVMSAPGIRSLARNTHVQNIGKSLHELYNNIPGTEKITNIASGIKRKYNTVIPNGALFNVNDRDSLVEVARNHLSVGGVSAVESEKLLNEIINANSGYEAGYKASAGVFDAIFKANADKISPKLAEQLKEATTVFKKSQDELSSYWASMHVNGANINIMPSLEGKAFTISSAHLDSELLHEHVFIPGAKDIMDIISRVNKIPLGSVTRDALDYAIGDVWKKFQLVRPAFVIRNIMEEQVRIFAIGHNSVFNNPIAFAAMWLGRDNGPAWRRLLAQYDRTRYTLPGKEFKALTKEDETAQLSAGIGAKNSYVNSVSNAELGSSDIRLNEVLQNNNITAVGINHPRAWDGIANQVRILRNSNFAKKVATTENTNEARNATLDYYLTGNGKEFLARYVGAKGKDSEILFTRDGLNRFLFTGVDATGASVSVDGRINELTGGLKQFREIIATGKVTIGNKTIEIPTIEQEAAFLKESKKNAIRVPIKKGNSSIHRLFASQLKDAFATNGKWDNGFLVNVPDNIAAAGSKSEKKFITRFNDAFFDTSVGFEKTTSMGPEYQMAYWDTIRSLSTSLDADAIKALEEVANKTLPKIRTATGLPVGKNHPVWDAFKMADKSNPGLLTLDEAHNYASKVAANRVKDLFYNATEKNQFWHQFRLVIPFGQAWENTIKEWGKLSFDNPIQLYKFSKSLDWLSSSKSSAIYGLTDVNDFYDPNQGFFYNDPTTNEKRFWVPFAGTLMAAASNIASGKNPFTGGTPIAFSASPNSFNFAVGSGSVLPPIGPGITIPTAVLDSFGMNPTDMMPDSLRKTVTDWIAPFGTKDTSAGLGLFDSFLSGNWSRIIGGASGIEAGYAAAFKPTMSYLANSGDFNMKDPLDQARLVEQTNHFARWFSIFRGITGMGAPATLIPEALGKDKDGKTTMQIALWNDFKTIEKNNNNNRDKSYADFQDLYGPDALFALTSNKAGASGLPTYEMIKKDPTIVATYPDIFGYMYPNANFSQAMYTWSLKNAGGRMSAKDIMEQVDDIRFYAAKDRLLTRATAENWTKDQQAAAMDSLKASYGGGVNKLVDVGLNDKVMIQLDRATQDPRFADSDAITGARDYLYLRKTALEKSGMKTLNNKTSAQLRDWLIGESAKIIQRNPGFQKIFWAFFSKELGA